jgi:hypothetical protein
MRQYRPDDKEPRKCTLTASVSRRALYGLDSLVADARQRLGAGMNRSLVASVLLSALADSKMELPTGLKTIQDMRIHFAKKFASKVR